MDLTQIPLFKAMAKKLAWLNQRQTVLAQNVANANTPGYKPGDLKPLDFPALLDGGANGSLKLAGTDSGHILAMPGRENTDFKLAAPETRADADLTGNAVNIEDQMMKVSQTATDYAFTASLYKKQVALFKTALGGGG